MTTVATDGIRMVADTLVTHEGTRSKAEKVFEVKGELVGIAGDYSAGLLFVKWYADRRKNKPELGEGFEAMVVSSRGIEVWDCFLHPMKVLEPFYACGSGKDAALGAMHAGADVARAVEIAARIDYQTDLPITQKILPSAKKRRKR